MDEKATSQARLPRSTAEFSSSRIKRPDARAGRPAAAHPSRRRLGSVVAERRGRPGSCRVVMRPAGGTTRRNGPPRARGRRSGGGLGELSIPPAIDPGEAEQTRTGSPPALGGPVPAVEVEAAPARARSRKRVDRQTGWTGRGLLKSDGYPSPSRDFRIHESPSASTTQT
jgi:hypothetical protein